ncbi:MAG: hypothetical protein HBSIN02_17130 [Bacteroidia bacterium]|nr:MAG: hypothetical protein HBSIN02_17130 [Bacteroidia bacterium]
MDGHFRVTPLIGKSILALASAAILTTAVGQVPGKSIHGSRAALLKSSGAPSYNILTVGSMTAWFRNDGLSSHSPQQDNGTYFPKGTGNVVYQDGFVWGGKMYLDAAFTQPAAEQLVRVGGGTYDPGTTAGHVIGFGSSAVPANPFAPEVRIYRIRRDFGLLLNQGDLRQEAALIFEQPEVYVTQAQMQAVYDQYEKDWNEWPVHLGAPYIERNGIPGYQAAMFPAEHLLDSLKTGRYDEPGIGGSDGSSPADQVIFMIFNDLDEYQSASFAESKPTGLEIQKTVWTYKGGFPLENIYFTRYKLINKGGVDIDPAPGLQAGSFFIDSMFVGQWVDSDIGAFSDDLVGCDVELNLGFGYNGNNEDDVFRNFGLAPPSVGYRVLQGPLVPSPSDSGYKDFRVVQGAKNLPMTSFAYLSSGSPYTDPPSGQFPSYASVTGQWWKLLRGYAPLGSLTTEDTRYAHPPGVSPTPFPLSGDPMIGTGFLDGRGTSYSFGPGDKRFLVSAGPFRLSPGDTQEIIISVVFGLGADRISSVGLMKAAAKFSETIHKGLFSVPRAPLPPLVTATELDGQIILEWGSSSQAELTESEVIARSYLFEGYNVYQLPSPSADISEGVRIATFDVKNGIKSIVSLQFDRETGAIGTFLTQEGSDSGVERFISVTRDHLLDLFFPPRLHNGQEYHFAVTAYNYSHEPGILPGSFESAPARISAKPRIPFGVVPGAAFGDSLQVTHSGPGEGSVSAIVVNPLVTTGASYAVRFRTAGNALVWDLENSTAGNILISGRSNQSGDGSFPIIDGIQVRVSDAPKEFKEFLVVANGGGPLVPPEDAAFSFNGFPYPSITRGMPDGTRQQTFGLNASQGWGIHVRQEGSLAMNYSVFLNRISNNGANWPRILDNQFELRFTAAGGKAAEGSPGLPAIDVPFELWNLRGTPADSSDDYRMIPVITDADVNGQFNIRPIDHTFSGSDNDPETESISWYQPQNLAAGDAGYQEWLAGTSTPGEQVFSNMVLVLWNGGSVADPSFPANVARLLPETGTIFRIVTPKRNSALDTYLFTAPTIQTGLEIQKIAAKRVGVFPNPYFAGRAQETTLYRNFVTFTNLPPRVTVRIFNLAGHLVRILEKNDISQYLEWDLRNKDNWQVASGLYLCYIEMPDIGETKVIKLAVIQPRISSY